MRDPINFNCLFKEYGNDFLKFTVTIVLYDDDFETFYKKLGVL